MEWTNGDIDAAYFLGMLAADNHEVPKDEIWPTVYKLARELERLKELNATPCSIIKQLRHKES